MSELFTKISTCIKFQDVSELQAELKKGFGGDPGKLADLCNEDGTNIIFSAVTRRDDDGRADRLRVLIDFVAQASGGAAVKKLLTVPDPNFFQRTPLMQACAAVQDAECVRVILAAGAAAGLSFADLVLNAKDNFDTAFGCAWSNAKSRWEATMVLYFACPIEKRSELVSCLDAENQRMLTRDLVPMYSQKFGTSASASVAAAAAASAAATSDSSKPPTANASKDVENVAMSAISASAGSAAPPPPTEEQIDKQFGMLGSLSGMSATELSQRLQKAAEEGHSDTLTKAQLNSLGPLFKGLLSDGPGAGEPDALHTSHAKKYAIIPVDVDRNSVKLPWKLCVNILMNREVFEL